ncbi:arginine transporter permease subunit ArtQ, partial [Salmonella enterica subsp. enterica serovar Enteritidis str. 22558]
LCVADATWRAESRSVWSVGVGSGTGIIKDGDFFRLVMPQMWRHALPGLGNQWLVLLKDTALVSLISVNDLMLQTKSMPHAPRNRLTGTLLRRLLPGHYADQSVHSQTHRPARNTF